MKRIMSIMAVLLSVGLASAEDGVIVAGPTGGKLLDNPSPRAEFFVNADRKVEIRLFDAELKQVPVVAQVINVIAEAPGAKTKFTMENKDGTLVSAEALPEGDGYNVVIQVRETAEAKPANFRIPLTMHVCGGCHLAEYACTCNHGGEEESHEGHGH